MLASSCNAGFKIGRPNEKYYEEHECEASETKASHFQQYMWKCGWKEKQRARERNTGKIELLRVARKTSDSYAYIRRFTNTVQAGSSIKYS